MHPITFGRPAVVKPHWFVPMLWAPLWPILADDHRAGGNSQSARWLLRGSPARVSTAGSVRGTVLERSPHFCAGALVSAEEEGSARSADSLGKWLHDFEYPAPRVGMGELADARRHSQGPYSLGSTGSL